ncbi:ATP-binding protein [Candidatus Chloroploca sp. M-50]|uniref:ATP-binding protein n=1 Tax=Candidatus Chloroploca mongolica TaxID=2528176 RepID=A0ABS4DD45_9CHLR|nr:ATP-binding protein [Candidatus Chloroploca mongolica]MBP1467363.1 ATP-binding protein [Candidatus Chloroploca mongolica]
MTQAPATRQTQNGPREELPPVTLRTYALAGIASRMLGALEAQPDRPEHALLLHASHLVDPHREGWSERLTAYFQASARVDWPLLRLAKTMALSDAEILAITLAAAVEDDMMIGRTIAYVQAPIGGSRPTMSLLATLYHDPEHAPIPSLVTGPAMRSGLLVMGDEHLPLPERPVRVPLAICLALHDRDADLAGATLESGPQIKLPAAIEEQAHRQALALSQATRGGLVIRTGSLAEGKAVAVAVAQALQRRPVYLDPTQTLPGLVPWLLLRQLLPVFPLELAPGEQGTLPALPGYTGPVLAISGPDGSVERAGATLYTWTLPVPERRDREALWLGVTGDAELAADLARHHRHSSGRIAHLGQVAQHEAHLHERTRLTATDLRAAAWASEGGGLEGLAQPLPQPIADKALTLDATLRRELEALVQRCLVRDELVSNLGVAATARYQPGVRALFVGPSGTGKTLAAGWLATRLGLPLYRVDLASVTSKYIGETEKNLAQLLARAEQSEVVLLFDEADSLFGKRTDVQQANDRFANAQTNYLLQRIESYDGITLLTSNSRTRFDPAFSRRLDMIIDFPMPEPEERRDLWLNHLGTGHTLTRQQINTLAALVDMAGGHIRNVVFASAARARSHDRLITFDDLLDGLTREYKKLGQQMPIELVAL